MSNLLKEAIVDAKALRESALKNAETIVIEKYSEEVKDTLQKLLEQEDDLGLALPGEEPAADAGADPLAADPLAADPPPALEQPAAAAPAGQEQSLSDEDIPLGATNDFSNMDGQNLDDFVNSGEGQQLTIDLSALQESIDALKQSLDEDEEIDLSEFLNEDEEEDELEEDINEVESDELEDAATEFAAGKAIDGVMSVMSEDEDTDGLVDAIMEKLVVDMGADLAGWAGRRQEDKIYQMEKEMAHRRSTDVEEEMKDLKKAQEEVVFENKQLTEKLSEYEAAIGELKEGLQDTNLSNARLLYTNRVLRNTSLNERQKDKIVEAISNAGSVTEAKTIYDTLQSAVEAKPKKSPQSLSEAIGRRNTVLRATRQEAPASDPFQDRMKRLAGIK